MDPASNRDETGGVLVENGLISAIGAQVTRANLSEDAEVHDCHGRVLAPGLIDMRVQLREPGEEHKETIETGSLAAAAGGVTSMVCLPNTEPIIDDVTTRFEPPSSATVSRTNDRTAAPRSIDPATRRPRGFVTTTPAARGCCRRDRWCTST